MPILHVSYDFIRLSDHDVDGFTDGILLKLHGNAAYPAPPVAKTALAADLKAFDAALAAMTDAGPSATAAKDAALAALVNQLRALALYVDANHGNDMSVLLSSGFHAASTNRAQRPLGQAAITKISFAGSGSLLVARRRTRRMAA